MNEVFFEAIIGEYGSTRERSLMGQRDFAVDFVEVFANIINGEFFKGVHHTPHGSGRSWGFYPDYPINFFLESFLNGYK